MEITIKIDVKDAAFYIANNKCYSHDLEISDLFMEKLEQIFGRDSIQLMDVK